jgi:nucleotide-binding universal stress UspA family protein
MAQIVIGVDGSETSLEALGAASDLAEQTGSQLVVVFVRDPGLAGAMARMEGEAEAAILQSEAELEASTREQTFDVLARRPVQWMFVTASGDAAHELVNIAQRRHAQLIVVGGHRHSTIGGVVLGSVAQRLLRASPVSVLVVRRPAPEPLSEAV